MKLVLTCEHGGNSIPNSYKDCFKNNEQVLYTHRGYDIGAIHVFNRLKPLSNFFKSSEVSRLLIELNRSLHHKNLFSEFTRILPKSEKEHLISSYYSDYRNDVKSKIKSFIDGDEQVVHISVHSFTPILNTVERRCDVGLLFDSKIKEEKAFCKLLKDQIKTLDPELNVRYNYPYLGKADGFTSYLRKQFPKNYIGIELEVNQKLLLKNSMDSSVNQTLFKSIEKIISI